jgi:hypothetical protein
MWWLLVELLPVRLIVFLALAGAGLQLGGVDLLGAAGDLLTGLVSPDWFGGLV